MDLLVNFVNAKMAELAFIIIYTAVAPVQKTMKGSFVKSQNAKTVASYDLDNANVPLSLRELFVKFANVKMEDLVVTANVSALNFLLEFFVMLSVFKGSTIFKQNNVNASQIMKDLLVNNAGV
jgi:hypothetical protein